MSEPGRSWRWWLVAPVGAAVSIGVGLATASYAVGSVDPVYHDGYRQPVATVRRTPAPVEDWRRGTADAGGMAYVESEPAYRPVREARLHEREEPMPSSDGMQPVATSAMTVDEPAAEPAPPT